MLSQQIDVAHVDETPSQILAVLLKAADTVLAKARAHTLRPYGHGLNPAYVPAADPTDQRMCA